MADQVRHKTFISYHRDDEEEVAKFIETFDNERDVFISRAIGSDQAMDELIQSDNDEYVMSRIRQGTDQRLYGNAALRRQEYLVSKVCRLGACREPASGPQGGVSQRTDCNLVTGLE